MKTIISHVVACTENGVIGRDGGMPWHLPDELKRFKAITMGKVLIMGRKTYESIGRPLPGRYSIVVSRSLEMLPRIVTPAKSLSEALNHAQEIASNWQNEICIVGGGEIYKQTLDVIDRIYLTRIQTTLEGDTFYPLDILSKFVCAETEKVASSIPYEATIWNRKIN
ncbi:MAG: dihydrofolate reductase [Proteobacteria bacterium]|nr:MAG: dihydrofolate reductase [Pseudomonadota bacterium]